MSFRDHFSRQGANAGIRLDLVFPDGKPSGDWLHILSVDSDAYRDASVESDRRVMALAAEKRGSALSPEVYNRERVERLSSLIFCWSFPEVCSPENKREFLENAPHIATMIDRVAVERSRFFTKPSTVCSSTGDQSSS